MTLSNGELNQTWAVSIIEPIQHELEDNFGLEPNASPLLLAPATTTSTTKARSWHSTTQIALWLLGLLSLTAVAFVLCRAYLGAILVFLQQLPGVTGPVLFISLYILVAFPFMMGVAVLNLGAGYLYGLVNGVLLCILGGTLGALIATTACRHCLKGTVLRLQNSYSNLKQISRVIEGEQGFRIICMARLTFVPFGLQNALFATSKISRRGYLMATAAGLFPMTLMNVYIGTTVRSMEAVMQGHGQRHYMVVVVGQLVVAAVVTIYVSQRMKREVLAACREGAQSKRSPQHHVVTFHVDDYPADHGSPKPHTCPSTEMDIVTALPQSRTVRGHRRSQSAGATLA